MSFKLIDSTNPVQEENVHKFEIPKEFCKPTGTSGMWVLYELEGCEYISSECVY